MLAVFGAMGCDNCPGKPDAADKFVRPGDVRSFAKLYEENCAACHGKNGTLGPAPPLNDAVFLAIVPEEVLLMTISGGRKGTEMPAFLKKNGGTLSAEQVQILATGLGKTWGNKPPTGEYPPYESTGKGDAARGKVVFAQACASCHGPDGRGSPQMTINDPAFLALSSDQVIRRIIITGRADLDPQRPMPDCTVFGGKTRPDLKAPLTTADIDDLVALIATWRK
jgi:mono/diheme cytochrome c family protein